MKPNFTLFLSTNGLRLLHRSPSGWQLVGTADIEARNLADVLRMLRRTATGLARDGINCRLILPNDQVRYLTLNSDGLDSGAGSRSAIAAALEGVTPYPVEDLVFDYTTDGNQCHVAAVARETLEEAEEFAEANGFAPVCFAAIPHDPVFLWEPSFGLSRRARAKGLKVTLADIPFREAPGNVIEKTEPARPTPSTEAPAELLFRSRRRAMPPAPIAGLAPPSFVPPKSLPNEKYTVPGFAAPQTPFAGRKPAQRRTPPVPNTEKSSRKPHKTLSEAEQLTVFGARDGDEVVARRGLDKRVIAASAALALVGLAAWSMGMKPAAVVTALAPAQQSSQVAPVAQFASPIQPAATPAVADTRDFSPKVLPVRATATSEETLLQEALDAPLLAQPGTPDQLALDAARAQYIITGIWVAPPDVPRPPEVIDLDDLYVTGIDPINSTRDAVALPDVGDQQHDASLPAPGAPAAAGTRFVLDDRGLVAPSRDGTMNPDGIKVFSGPPPARPPQDFVRATVTRVDPRFEGLADVRPRMRPEDLQEQTERATYDGLTRSELAAYRPQMRPQADSAQAGAAQAGRASLVPLSEDEQSTNVPAGSIGSAVGTGQVIARSLRPDARPSNFEELVARNQRAIGSTAAPARTEPEPVQTASVAPRIVTPKIPTSTSTAREATIKNAINLRQINLIGVYGKPSDRRAIVRLANGRTRNVQVGDKIDGGQISAIGDAELRYQKSGRNHVLKMPRS